MRFAMKNSNDTNYNGLHELVLINRIMR